MQLTDIHACVSLGVMTKPYGELFSDALVLEVKAEMGRQDLSSRALGRLIGKSSQYMSDRLDGGSAKTGRRVLLSVQDLAAIAEALGMRPSDLTVRAHFLALGGDANALPTFEDDLAARRRDRTQEVLQVDHDRAVAKKKSRDRGGDDGQG